VLADFFGVWNKMMGVNHWKDIKNIDQALQKIKDTNDFWINLPMTPNGKTLLNAIKKFKGKYNILSAPLPGDPNSEPQKREWIKKHLGMFPPAKIIIDHNKAAYAKQADGTPNALIDDFGENISKWRNAGGVGIQHKDIAVGDTISKLEKELDSEEESNESTNQYVLTPHQNLPNTKSMTGGTTMVTKSFKNLQKQQANTQAAVDARQGAGMSRIGTAPKINKSDFSKNIFPTVNKKPRIT
uniref:hypothetical protein n=1 Tax=Winogradskyella sp. TaxID=1883156 RepID=UPI0035141D53